MFGFKTGYTVADAMTHNPITISQNLTLRQAAKIMAEKHVGSLLVKEKNAIIGIVTEQDMVRKGIILPGNPALRKVKDIMAANLITISPNEDIFHALREMREYNIRHLPVMNDGKFVGFITMKDILKVEPDLYEILVEKIELREAERKPVK